MDFDLRQLEVFCKVIELQGFSSAARAVNLAQASVSERIANLEAAVGTRLLDRLGRCTVPTKAGELLYGKAQELLGKRRETVLAMEAFLGVKKGPLLIGASTIPGNFILPTLIGQFRQRFPEVTLTVKVGDTADIAGKVARGEVEAGFVGSTGGEPGLNYTRLWDDELVLVVPARHPWAGKASVGINDLLREPFVAREEGSGTQRSLLARIAEELPDGVNSLDVVCELGSSGAVKEAVKGGVGVAFISSRAVETEVRAGQLAKVVVRGIDIRRNFYLAEDSRRFRSPVCSAFVEFVMGRGSQ